MKKSERYQMAMLSVLANENIDAADKLEIISTLMSDQDVAKWNEKREEEK